MTIDEIKPGILVRYDVDAYCNCYQTVARTMERRRAVGAVVFRIKESLKRHNSDGAIATVAADPHSWGGSFFSIGDTVYLDVRILIPYVEPLKPTRRLTVRNYDDNH